jgi:hypothetical protein
VLCTRLGGRKARRVAEQTQDVGVGGGGGTNEGGGGRTRIEMDVSDCMSFTF